ncbi:hypothetical protein QNH47_13245 [Virgibacillus halodenitrificans]|uniref:hypothetical protein n=1 Tax=Virgibacillus halodenitrificans TaxID=1482 RepID=UPI0024C08330|nr:hypothetical protein [Virgibacillus halodenitrificans]WHX25133.1 hypothetical protein QNH47_13245 [Virgibacillus halodenitrificans]
MYYKNFICSVAYIFLIAILTACGNNAIKGSGEMKKITPEEVQAFAMEDTGFIYIKSPLKSDNEADEKILQGFKRAAEQQEIDFYVFDEGEHQKWVKDDLGVNLLSQSIGFYQNGEKKEGLDLSRVNEKDQALKEINQFIDNVKSDYFN